MMLRLISTLLILGWMGALLTGCAGEYTPYEEVSASENHALEADAAPADAVGDPSAATGAEGGVPAAPAGGDAAAPAAADASGSASVPAAPDSALPAPANASAGQQDSGAAQPPASGVGDPLLDPAQAAIITDPLAARLANAGGPVNIEIPAIGVSAPIENVGQTAEGAMDAPQGWMNVGWYDKGFQPGESGNSVIAGHLDNNAGGPAVFWDLGQLTIGDEVAVTYANGDRYTFIVEDWKIYDHDADGPTIDSIFGMSQTADLNLVTCDGVWDHGAATYDKRLVVFTTLEPEKTVLAGGSGVME